MRKPHMKGYILQLLEKNRFGMWDYEIVEKVMSEYNHSGGYWHGEVRANLTDLFSGALLEEVEDRLDDGDYFGVGKVLVKFRLSSFGYNRMLESDLL